MTPPITPDGMQAHPTCDHCARSRAGMWQGYRDQCEGCTARAIARSAAAFNALHPAGDLDRRPLRNLIAKAMPHTDYLKARGLVWGWWRRDHTEEKGQP